MNWTTVFVGMFAFAAGAIVSAPAYAALLDFLDYPYKWKARGDDPGA